MTALEEVSKEAVGRSRISLGGRKRPHNSDISPAPAPRTSNRLVSSSDDERTKVGRSLIQDC